ncbi:MAG: hypothetical protein N2B06_10815, partial [Clostridium sp.]
MNLIDNFKCVLPSICLITDDPYRVKMIAAHYLDKVEIFTETRGQVGLIGEFNNIPLIVMSVGIGITSTMAYLTELCSKNKIKRIVYFGDCITHDSSLAVGAITYISKAYENDQCFEASENISGFDSKTTGSKTVTVTAYDKTETFNVDIVLAVTVVVVINTSEPAKVVEELKAAAVGSTTVVQVGTDNKVDSSIFAAIAGQDKNVVF